MNILSCVTAELNQDLLGCLEVLPGALRSDINSAVGVTGPAILAGIEEIIGVHVGCLLVAVVALSVEPVLRLQG